MTKITQILLHILSINTQIKTNQGQNPETHSHDARFTDDIIPIGICLSDQYRFSESQKQENRFPEKVTSPNRFYE